MKPIDDPQEFQRIMAARNRIAANQRALSRKWISDTGVFAMAAEGIVHFVDDEYKLFADAFRAEAPGRLFGVSNEDGPPGWDHAVMVEQSTEEELEQIETEFYGQYFLLFSEDERHAVLFTQADYKLIAVQKQEFIEFKNEELSYYRHTVGYEQAMETAARFMNWLD